MTVLIVPEVAYRPILSNVKRPHAWQYHLLKCLQHGTNVKTVCGLVLDESEMVPVAEVPCGKMCKQCLGALRERED